MKRWLWVLLPVAALAAMLRPVGPHSAIWDGRSGDFRVPATWTFLWRWQAAVISPQVVATVTLRTSEGAAVAAQVRMIVASGAHVKLVPAASPEDGLAAKLTQLAPNVALPCVADTPCRKQLEKNLQEALRQDAQGVVETEVVLEPDPAALLALSRQKLRQAVGTPPRRVVLLGWDGADWELLSELVARGFMPNLEKLMKAGTFGELTSLVPLLSPLIWTTIATGEPPEAHGVLDFLEVDEATGARVPVTGRKRKVPALWNIASVAGLSVGVSGWWASWPAETVNGAVVSDRLFFLLSDAPGDAPPGTVVFPPDREAEFRQLTARAQREVDVNALHSFLPLELDRLQAALAQRRGMADPVDGFRRVLVGTQVYLEAATLLAQARPHLLMAYCIGTDEVGHLLAPYLPPKLRGTDAELVQVARPAVERYFATVDTWLGRLLEHCPLSQCAVILVSDHGFKWGSDRPREFSGVAAATAALWHRPKGIFVVAGNGVAARGRVGEPASVYDVAPTVTALLGLPAGDSWRGKPLPGVLVASPETVAWAKLAPPESFRPHAQAVKPSAEYVAQLKALGYLEGGEAQGGSGTNTEGELNNLGLIHLEAGRFPEAEEAFKKAIAANRTYASPHYNLRRLYFETGRYEDANRELLEALRLGLRDGRGALQRALADYERLGLKGQALALASSAIELFPKDSSLHALHLRYLVELNRCAEALEQARQAVGAFPQDATVLSFAGLAAACAGDKASARQWIERSLALNPGQPELRQALEMLE